MRAFLLDSNAALPLVDVKIRGKSKELAVGLVFDTGAFMTQLSTMVVEELGFSARDGMYLISAHGPSGPIDEGYTLEIPNLQVLGKSFSNVPIAAYDFSNLESSGIDGLLGFDLIKQMHLEMNGPKGELLVFD